MAKTSSFTKRTRFKYWTLKVLQNLLLFLPLMVYIAIALVNPGVIVVEKMVLLSSITVALILTGFNFVSKRNLRSPLWIVVLGLYFAIGQYLMPLIVILAVVSLLDDVIFRPLIGHYRVKLIASKTIDERF